MKQIILIGLCILLVIAILIYMIPIQIFLHTKGDTFKERLECSKYVERIVSNGYNFGSGRVYHSVNYELGGNNGIMACKHKLGLYNNSISTYPTKYSSSVGIGYFAGLEELSENKDEAYCLSVLKCAGISTEKKNQRD